MKVFLVTIGKTDDQYIVEGIIKYVKRINRYHPFEIVYIPDIKKSKKLSFSEQKKQEGLVLLKELARFDKVILLDENGKNYTSMKFAKSFEKYTITGFKNLAFVIGGPYGFSDEVKSKYREKLALSEFTFSHQLVRLLFVEQLYRINTIIKGEPYHHQ
jgi:23S rRNA (pseudouridine1915-N3)-methyltransferase